MIGRVTDPDIVVGAGSHQYTWRELPSRPFGSSNDWSHHGLAGGPGGQIVGFEQRTRSLVSIDRDGRCVARVAAPVRSAHGIAVVQDATGPATWVADIGKTNRLSGGTIHLDEGPAGVVKVGSNGDLLDRLDPPSGDAYANGAPYLPTSIAVDEKRHGGGGDVWVADGYGQSLVHRFGVDGRLLATIDGADGAGRFAGPHGVWIDRRRAEPELLVADRTNHRVQVFDLDGHFKRSYGGDFLISPSGFATTGELLVIADLRSRLTLVDLDDRLVCHLGDGGAVYEESRWPNVAVGEDHIGRRPHTPGRFSSPHGMAAAPDGAIFVAEWRVGGCVVALEPRPAIS
jgi:hypothetical protein